jgi:hypothetical protein
MLVDMGVKKDVAEEIGFNVAQFFEYDDAYRYCVQDLMGELHLENFKTNPSKEIRRIVNIFSERDTVKTRFNKFKVMLPVILLFIPLIKKSLRKNVVYLKQMHPDHHDKYWMCLRNDGYDYFGLNIEERHALYTERPITYQVMA